MNIPLMNIEISLDPNIFSIGSLLLTWHGFFTFVAVAVAVYLAGRWAKEQDLDPDAVYSVAAWGIIGGIIGTRVLHVIDLWDDVYQHDLVRIFQIWEGGLAIFGAVLGGFLGGAGYMAIRNHPRFLALWAKLFRGSTLEKANLPPIGRLADLAAPAMLLAMAIGRIGDIINGEHVAKATDYSWGLVYSHISSPSNFTHGLAASHPAVAYEMLWDLAVLAIIWPLRNRLRPFGMVFASYLAIYSLGRFFISFLRLDREWALGLNEAQFVSLAVLAVTIPILLLKAKVVKPTPPMPRPKKAKAGTGG